MNRLFGALVFGCLFAMGYVVVNGPADTYLLFGDNGIYLSGWRVLLAGSIFLVGVGAFALGLRTAKRAASLLSLVAMAAVGALLWQAFQSTQTYNQTRSALARPAPGETQTEVSCRALDALMQGLAEDRPEHEVNASGDVFVDAARRSGNPALSSATNALVTAMDNDDEVGFSQALDEVYSVCDDVLQAEPATTRA